MFPVIAAIDTVIYFDVVNVMSVCSFITIHWCFYSIPLYDEGYTS